MSGQLCLPAEYNTRRRYAILLLHEGAPVSLSYWSVACFLAEHLKSRRRVDTLPRWIWYPIIYFLVLPWRAFYETRSYARFWIFPSQSTMHVHSSQIGGQNTIPGPDGQAICVYYLLVLAMHLQRLMVDLIPRMFSSLRQDDISIQIEIAFSSQPGSVDAALERFYFLGNYTGVKDSKQRDACVEEEHLLVLPLYPQYGSVQTGVAFDAVTKAGYFAAHRTVPFFQFVRSYATNPAYIHALATYIKRYCAARGPPDWLFIVFEGLSKRFITSGDCYQVECQRTFAALRTALSTAYTHTATVASESVESKPGSSRAPEGAAVEWPNRTIPFNRITIGFLDWGVEPCLEPSTSHVIAGVAAQIKRLGECTSTPDEAENGAGSEAQEPKTLGTAYFVCPGMAVDGSRSLQLVQRQLCRQCLESGWLRAEYIPAMNESPEQIKMLASLIAEYIR